MTLWHGRFGSGPADELLAFTASLHFDQRLAADDIVGSRAHVRGLVRAGLLDGDESAAILAALATVADELAAGSFEFGPADEDIHTAIERRVTEIAGPPGGKLHTGRSRNDQVATALRLWCKRELREVAARVVSLQEVLLARASEAGDAYLPGYTHVQRAQPVLLAHHLLAHGWALARDVDRLLATVERLDVSPLGAGALAGSSLPLDPHGTALDLGFAASFENSLDAVSDRDFVAEALFDLALLGVHLSRIGEEWVLWTSSEFGFAVLDDAHATGSSMMPQKKNADIAELARGKAGRLIGHVGGFLATLKGLPLSYNRDLQEDKEPLFDAVDQTSPRARRADRDDRGRIVRASPHGGGGRRPDARGHRLGGAPRRAGDAIPRGARGRRRPGPRVDLVRNATRRPRAVRRAPRRGRGGTARARCRRHAPHDAGGRRSRSRGRPGGALPRTSRRRRGPPRLTPRRSTVDP